MSGTQGRVSIIVPCYNGARHLAQALDSALAQTYSDVEVVLVDDGSSDGSLDIARTYGGRIRVVAQANRGLSAARNAGIAHSTGEFLLLLDADDVLLPECAEKRVGILREHPDVGLVAGYFREIDGKGSLLPRIPERRRIGTLNPFRQAVRRNWGPPVGWTFRREAFERCGAFDPNLKSCEDWDFVIRVARRWSIGYDPTVQVLYRQSEGQMSRNYAVMLDAARRVQMRNRALASGPLAYWFDCQWGRFELGRRILFHAAFGERGAGRVARMGKLVASHPSLLWIGALAAASFLVGKRPTNDPAGAEVPADAAPVAAGAGSKSEAG
jgi:glycosyltransferase involved in cell wall biosynthesis